MKTEEIKATMRSRHKLKDDATVCIMQSRVIMKAEDDDPHKFTARITTEAVDRQDEVVVSQGGDMGEFLSTGAIYWNHDYSTPVGFPNKAKRIERGENYIACGGIFMQRPADYVGEFFPDFAREFVTQGYKAGINPGVSIGFIPIETRNATKGDVAKYGQNCRVVHSKWKLLEFSIAPMQANQDAVITAVGKGLISPRAAKAAGYTIPSAPLESPVVAPRRVIEEMIVVISKRTVDIDAIAKQAAKEQMYKRFGRVFA